MLEYGFALITEPGRKIGPTSWEWLLPTSEGFDMDSVDRIVYVCVYIYIYNIYVRSKFRNLMKNRRTNSSSMYVCSDVGPNYAFDALRLNDQTYLCLWCPQTVLLFKSVGSWRSIPAQPDYVLETNLLKYFTVNSH